MKKITMLLAVLALTVAGAWAKSYELKLNTPTFVGGNELKPGDYQLKLDGTKLTITNGAKSIQCDVTVESGKQKFQKTSVRMEPVEGKYRIEEIRLGGTETKLLVTEPAGAAGGR